MQACLQRGFHLDAVPSLGRRSSQSIAHRRLRSITLSRCHPMAPNWPADGLDGRPLRSLIEWGWMGKRTP
jgi:hypothetical protein